MQKVTINSVAAHAGVSKKTVSRVLNKEPNVSEATREKVLKAFKDLNYTPNPIARGLARNRSYIIGCLYDNPSKSYITRVQSGALEACQKAGYNLLIHPCELRGEALLNNVDELITTSRLDGIVLTPPFSDSQELVDFLKDRGIPYARVASVNVNDDSIAVASNDEEAAFEMTQHLLGLGHTRIGFIKGHPDHSATHERFRGFTKALKDAKVPLDETLIQEGNFSYHSGEQCAKALFALKERPTAIFSSNDYMAAAVLKVAAQQGVNIPNEMSIVGFDNAPIARHIWPGITTIDQPVETMTEMAVTQLIAHIKAPEEPIKHTLLPAKLITRESSTQLR